MNIWKNYQAALFRQPGCIFFCHWVEFFPTHAMTKEKLQSGYQDY